jgi:hypothetical protein
MGGEVKPSVMKGLIGIGGEMISSLPPPTIRKQATFLFKRQLAGLFLIFDAIGWSLSYL